MQNSNLFVMKTYRSNDKTSRSPRQRQKSFKAGRSRVDHRNVSIPFVLSSRNTPRVPKSNFLSSKTDEKRPRVKRISKISGTLELNDREFAKKSLLGSEDLPDHQLLYGKSRDLKNVNLLMTPPKKGKNGRLQEDRQTRHLSKKKEVSGQGPDKVRDAKKENANLPQSNFLFGNIETPFSINIKGLKSGEEDLQGSSSKLSQNFISDANNKELPKVDKINHFPRKRGKNSFFEYSSLDKQVKEAESKFDMRAPGKENETLSYNLSGTLQSKRMEFSGKIAQYKSKSLSRGLISKRGPKTREVVALLLQNVRSGYKFFFENCGEDALKLLKRNTRRFQAGLVKKCLFWLRLRWKKAKIVHHILQNVRRMNRQSTRSESVVWPTSDQLVTRDFSSKKQKKKGFMNSYKKRDETVTTKEILTCQSTNKLNSHKKKSYMFNTCYKTGQKNRQNEEKKNTLIMSECNRERPVGSVLTYSDVNKTNLSNHLKKESEGVKTGAKLNQTKRRQKGLGNKENKQSKGKKAKRPPMRSVSNVMKLKRDLVFNGKSGKTRNSKKTEPREKEDGDAGLSPSDKRESETDRVQKKGVHLKSLEFETQKSLISNFWNDKLTKRQSLQQSKLKKKTGKPAKEKKPGEKRSTQVKWKRKTVKSLRDKGLELKGPGGGESLLSSKQETSLMKGSMRRVSMTGMALLKNKSPGKLAAKTSALKIKKIKRKLATAQKDQSRVKVNKSIKMNLKGNFRKMKSISPPSNWSLSRFNKMKNNFFKKRKGDNLKSKPVTNKKEATMESLPSKQGSGKKKTVFDKESPQEIGSSSNFYCHNPYSTLKDQPLISRVLANPRESADPKPSETFNENNNKFFKKTLPEISEGETNESSEHTVIMSSTKKASAGAPKEEKKGKKITAFKSNRHIQKEEPKNERKKDVIHRHSFGVNMKSSEGKQGGRKSPLGKRLMMQNQHRVHSRSTNEFKNYMREPYTSDELSNSSRNHNLRKKFEDISKNMKKNSEGYYLGNPRLLEKNEDTRFKILNAKKSVKRKSRVDGSRLTDNGREPLESQETETLQSDATKTSPNNFLLSRKPQTGGLYLMAQANRSLDHREKQAKLGPFAHTPDRLASQNKPASFVKNAESLGRGGLLEKNRSLDKGKFYLPRNLKAFKSTKMNLANFEKHKLSQQKTLHTRSELKRVTFMNRKKKMQINGSQDSFKTQDYIQKRFKGAKAAKSKAGLMIIKKKIHAKNSLLKAKSFDKSRGLKDNGFGVFTFGK